MRERIARLDARQEEQVEFLARLVNRHSGTGDVVDVNRRTAQFDIGPPEEPDIR